MICDPTYVSKTEFVKKVGRVVRSICILDHPIPNTNDVDSCQIIIPQRQVDRNSDIYINMISSSHAICAKGLYVAIVSTTVETDEPESEIEPGLALLGDILEQFTSVDDLYMPTQDGSATKLFVTKSYDPTSHFESASDDVLAIYKKIFGQELDLTVLPESEE